MRPDEAFWNAIRDTGNAGAIELFLKAHPGSPYVQEAQKKLKALGGEKSPAKIAPLPENGGSAPPNQATSQEADVASKEHAALEKISFLGILGLSFRDAEQGLVVKAVADGSEFADSVQPGDRMITVEGKSIADLTGLADHLTYLSFGREPIEFELARSGSPVRVIASSALTKRLQTALKGLAEGERGVQTNVWRADQGQFAPELAGTFAILNPMSSFASTARQYAFAFNAIRPLVSDKTAMLDLERRLKSVGGLDAFWVNAPNVLEALKNFQRSRGEEATGVLTSVQLDALADNNQSAAAVVEEIAKRLSDENLNPDAAQAVLDRAILVYQQILSKWDTPEPTKVLLALQQHYGLPETGRPTIDVINLIVRANVRLPPGEQEFLQAALSGTTDSTTELSAALEKAGVDPSLLPQLLKRVELAYRQAPDSTASASLGDMIETTNARYGWDAARPIDSAFLKRLLSEKVQLPDEGGDEAYTTAGDWKYIKTDSLCVMATSVFDMKRIDGAFLEDGAPRASIQYTPDPRSASLAFFIGNERMFAPNSPVNLIAGGVKVPLEANVAGGYGEKSKQDGTIAGLVPKLFARASDAVTLTGQSPFGGGLSIQFSAKGFSRAFQAINAQCAEGRLSVWLR